MSDDNNNTFWSKLAVIAALLSALAAFLGVLHQFGLFTTNQKTSHHVVSNTNETTFLENDVNAPRKSKTTRNDYPSNFNFDDWYNQQVDEMAAQGIIDQRERENLYMPKNNH